MLSYEAEALPVTYGVMDFIDKAPFHQTKPYTIAGPLPAEYECQRTNLVTSPRSIALRDVRGHESLLDIDQHGVEIVKLVPRIPLDTISDELAQEYLVDLASWVQQRLGAIHCFCYAYKFRSSAIEPDRAPGSYLEATLEYLVDDPKWKEEKPYRIFFKTDSTISQSNCRFEAGKAHVQNVRQLTKQHSFERDELELIQSPIQALHATDFEDPQTEESVVVSYLQATMEFVKNRLSDEHIICIDWRFRAQGREEKDLSSLEDLANVRSEAL